MKKMIISKFCTSFVGLLLLFGCATTSGTKEASLGEDLAVITDIQIEDGNVVIKSNKSFAYTIYNANDPYKTTIDIPDMTLGAFTGKITPDKSVISEIIPQQINSPNIAARIDIVLESPSEISSSYHNNTLALSVKQEQPVVLAEYKAVESENISSQPAAVMAVAKTPSYVVKAAEENIQPMSKATEIRGIELKKNADGVIVIITGNGAIMPNVFPINERIVVDIPGVSLNTTLPEGVISPLKGIRAGQHKDKLRLVFDLKEKTNFDVTAIGNSIEIALMVKEASLTQSPSGNSDKADAASVAPAKPVKSAPEPAALIEGEFTGKKISLDFQDADVRPVFRLLVDVSGYNLVLDPAVKGNITIKLLNVPWDQALDIILNTLSLAKSIEGNILWIAPTNVFARITEEKQKAKDIGEKAEDLEQEVVRVNYATAGDISSAVTSGKLLTSRGNIAIDGRMNTLIIKDTQKSIDKIKDLVKIMDVPKPQVMIEARIVEVSTSYSESLGIRWGGVIQGSGVKGLGDQLSGSFAVNTPVAPTTGPGGVLGMTIGSASHVQINLSLSALEGIGKSKTLSNPRVLTMDNEAATIQQGRSFFVQTVSQAGTATEEKKATLSLNVTPKITPDGYVQLKVTATDDSLEGGIGGASAVVNTKSLNTNALIKSGETLVLGGIYTTGETEVETGVPLLSRMPVLGWLFKTKTQTGPNTKEMLIFITPTILDRTL